MAQFRPFEMDGIPIEEQFMNWKEIVKAPYDRKSVDAYTRTRVILINGIEDFGPYVPCDGTNDS